MRAQPANYVVARPDTALVPFLRNLNASLLSCKQPQAQLKAQARHKNPERRGCWLWVNAKTLEGALDPLFLAFSLCISLSAVAAGIFSIIRSNSFNFTVNSWSEFTQVCVRELHRHGDCAGPGVALVSAYIHACMHVFAHAHR